MARRSPPRNELQDPSLPQRQRARWRVIGAAVLALAAVVMLPLALDSEPKQSLSDVAIQIPERSLLQVRKTAFLFMFVFLLSGRFLLAVESITCPLKE